MLCKHSTFVFPSVTAFAAQGEQHARLSTEDEASVCAVSGTDIALHCPVNSQSEAVSYYGSL